MDVRDIKDQNIWDSFILVQDPETFLQSWSWGEVNAKTGDRIWRLGFFENGILIMAALVVKITAKRGSFLFVPHGPVMNSSINGHQKLKILNNFFEYVINLGKRERADFVRISPLMENNRENLEMFKRAGFRNAPIHMMHPELTWLLDISKSEQEIMKEMRKTHRNLIRRADKDGVVVIRGIDEKYLKSFYDIHMETVSRHKFVPFSYEYIRSEIDAFKKNDQVLIFSAVYNSSIISSAVIVFFGKTAYYHHGASSSLYSKIPASYLILWNAIKEAKSRGCRTFNFYGIVQNKPKHPWAGLSKFKQGFGGYKKEILHCQDYVLRKKYIANYIIESVRKIKRGY